MVTIWSSPIIRYALIVLLFVPAVGLTADFELYWDPNCNGDPDLEGYFIYYADDQSVLFNSQDATEIYVSLSDSGFDPNNPSYNVRGLIDGVRYCFAITAFYGEEESVLSNEICGVNGSYTQTPGVQRSDSGGSSGGGCFIGHLK